MKNHTRTLFIIISGSICLVILYLIFRPIISDAALDMEILLFLMAAMLVFYIAFMRQREKKIISEISRMTALLDKLDRSVAHQKMVGKARAAGRKKMENAVEKRTPEKKYSSLQPDAGEKQAIGFDLFRMRKEQ